MTKREYEDRLKTASLVSTGFESIGMKSNIYGDGKSTLVVVADKFLFDLSDGEVPVLMYETGTHSRVVAEAVRAVSSYVYPSEWKMGREYFYDESTETAHYGMEAAAVKTSYSLKQKGLIQCPACERVFRQCDTDNHGICEECNVQLDAMVWV